MPNWCYLSVVIYSKSRPEVENFHDKLQEVILKPYDDKVVAPNWLGNMCIYSGYSYDDVLAEVPGYCRAWIQSIGDVESNEDADIAFFFVSVESAWSPQIQPFRSCISKLFPENSLKIAWIAEECGCELYEKYDPDGLFFVNSEYCMDCYCDNDTAYQKYPELQEGCEDYSAYQLMEIFNLPNMDAVMKKADEITEALEEEYGEGYIYIHKYEEMESEF